MCPFVDHTAVVTYINFVFVKSFEIWFSKNENKIQINSYSLPELQKSFGQQGVTANDLDGISAIAVNSNGQLIVAEHENRRIKTVNKKGQCLLIFESPAIHDQDVIGQPVAMAVDKNDHVFVLITRMRDYFIVKYDDKGKAVTWFEMQDWFADEPARVCGMAINSQGLSNNTYVFPIWLAVLPKRDMKHR